MVIGMDPNPYQASVAVGGPQMEAVPIALTGRAGSGRFFAAQIDHAIAVVLFFAVGMSLAESAGNIIAGAAALATYLCSCFLPEWLLGTTAGKAVFSLRVRQVSGEPCTAWQIAIRTLSRLVEVNPLLLGALPAGIAILSTSRRQRIGDLLANTVVVRRSD
jgi:uncharacterized RDD family membrane protein YckC